MKLSIPSLKYSSDTIIKKFKTFLSCGTISGLGERAKYPAAKLTKLVGLISQQSCRVCAFEVSQYIDICLVQLVYNTDNPI